MSLGLSDGAVFAGRYQIVRRIASGAMGAVYEVIHLETTRRRALKVMLPHIIENEELRERFKLEARVAAHIESDFIVDVFDAGVDGPTGMPFLVMELLRGEELGARLKRVGRFQPAEALTYLRQTALALDKAHRASIIHRDLKPGNLFLTEQDDGTVRIKVLDFGIAKLIVEGTSPTTTAALGTPLYMAPEQFRSGKISPATDIYALGMIAYTLLVGESYWAAEIRENNQIAFMLVACNGPRELASLRAAHSGAALPPGFDGWFARMTSQVPEARFPTVMSATNAFAEMLGAPLARSSIPSINEVDSANSKPDPAAGLGASGTANAVTRELPSRRPSSRRFAVSALLGGTLVLGGVVYVAMRNTGVAPAVEAAAEPTAAPMRSADSAVSQGASADAGAASMATSASPDAGAEAASMATAASPDAGDGAPPAATAATTLRPAPIPRPSTMASGARKPEVPGGADSAPATRSSANLGLRQNF